jgi:hypothetical protein
MKLPPKCFHILEHKDDPQFVEVYGTGVLSGESWVVLCYADSFYQWMAGQPSSKVLWYLSVEDRLFLDEGYGPKCLEILEEQGFVHKGNNVHSFDWETQEYKDASPAYTID